MKTFLRNIITILTFLVILLTSACQPSGGDFVPIVSDGAKIKSLFDRENNALQYNTGKFLIKVAGDWGVDSARASLSVILKNNETDKLVVDFDKVSIKNSLGQKLDLKYANRFFPRDETKTIEDRVVNLSKNETRGIVLSFEEKNGKLENQSKYVGQVLSLTIPVTVKSEGSSFEANYEFNFKYDYHLPQVEYKEELTD